MTDAEYFAYELAKLGPAPTDIRLKITSETGATRWLTLTPEQLAQVGAALTT